VTAGLDELEVRRRALEALAFSSRRELAALIEEAYDSDELQLRVSALFAMGRTADSRWAQQVQAELGSPVPELRFEAARAAGELELSDAAPVLAELAQDEDPQVREAAIWSLSQVGGTTAQAALNQLLEAAEDEAEQEYLQEALENLEFTTDMESFALFDFEAEDTPDPENSDDEDDD
jgi:HEAT repeat protein